MAMQTCFLPHITIHQSVHLKKSVFGMVLFKKNQLSVKKAAKLQIKSSIRNQVFEDHATGIICYKDEQGEIICEGFDEGPRLLKPHYPLRDVDILESLQQSWLEIMDGQTTNESGLLEEHNCNGFNALH